MNIGNIANNDDKTTNNRGGKQSKLEVRFDLIDTKAIFKLSHVLYKGAIEYCENNWRNIQATDHINHALSHLYAYLAEDTGSDHLAHAFTRIMMAIGTEDEG